MTCNTFLEKITINYVPRPAHLHGGRLEPRGRGRRGGPGVAVAIAWGETEASLKGGRAEVKQD